MKLFEYVDLLEKIAGEHGNLELITASDDEGNSYHPVVFGPASMFVEGTGELEHYIEGIVGEDDKEDGVEYTEVICLN